MLYASIIASSSSEDSNSMNLSSSPLDDSDESESSLWFPGHFSFFDYACILNIGSVDV